MVAIVVHAFKTLLKFVDFEKKVDYYFILLMNVLIVGICFMLPVFIDYLLLLKIKDEFFSIILSITTYESSPDSCVKCYTMFLPFLLIKIDVFS